MGRVVKIASRRLLWVLPTACLVLAASFLLLRFVPGGPYDHAADLPEGVKEKLAAQSDLSETVSVQFIRYVSRVASGDLDWSMTRADRSVNQILRNSLPISLQLGLLALGITLIGGLALGNFSVSKRGSPLDRTAILVTTIGFSTPASVLGTAFILIFASSLALFPPALWEGPIYLVLPALTLAAAPGSLVARLTRDGLRSALSADHVRTARAKGLSETETVWRHALRNALAPVSRKLGPVIALLVTGSVVVEHVFSIPGVGRHLVSSAKSSDLTVVVGLLLVYAAVIILANLTFELFRGVLDPPRRLSKMP